MAAEPVRMERDARAQTTFRPGSPRSPSARVVAGTPFEATAICHDSRKVKPGAVFVAVHGLALDGNTFIADAMQRGARYVDRPGRSRRSRGRSTSAMMCLHRCARHACRAGRGGSRLPRPSRAHSRDDRRHWHRRQDDDDASHRARAERERAAVRATSAASSSALAARRDERDAHDDGRGERSAAPPRADPRRGREARRRRSIVDRAGSCTASTSASSTSACSRTCRRTTWTITRHGGVPRRQGDPVPHAERDGREGFREGRRSQRR